jgi:hypothetical protein
MEFSDIVIIASLVLLGIIIVLVVAPFFYSIFSGRSEKNKITKAKTSAVSQSLHGQLVVKESNNGSGNAAPVILQAASEPVIEKKEPAHNPNKQNKFEVIASLENEQPVQAKKDWGSQWK